MNIHIELVKKWLADNDSVTLEELESNEDAAWDATIADIDDDGVWTAMAATVWATMAAAMADWADDKAQRYKQCAIEAIEEYEELTK
jgi:hypothetical protein